MTRTIATWFALWLALASAVAVGVLIGSLLATVASASRSALASPSPSGELTSSSLPGRTRTPQPVSLSAAGLATPAADSPSPSASSTPVRATSRPSGLGSAASMAASMAATISGLASTYGPGWDGWLALPDGPGITVRVCGAGGCIVRTSNDAGPSLAFQRAGRVVDLDVADFEAVCGYSWRRGLCPVTVTPTGGPND